MPVSTLNNLRQKTLSDLERSGLTKKDFTKLRITTLNESKTQNLTEYFETGSYRIPYWSIDGTQSRYYRIRFLDLSVPQPTKGSSGKKHPRYWQPSGTLPSLYLPPFLDWRATAKDEETTLYITEGEKKAARACKAGIPCIGLGGVWSWRSAKKGVSIIEDFKQFNWKNRTVVVVFDSDVHEKQEVQQALSALGKELITLGALPYTIKLPSSNNEKVGLDDYLESKGEKAFLSLPREQLLGELGEQLWALNKELAYIKDSESILKLESNNFVSKQTLIGVTYANRLVTVETEDGVRRISAANEWLKWPHRRTHNKLTYSPGQEPITNQNEYNLWTGWGVEPQPGNCTPWGQLLEYVFQSNPENKKWFLQWLAYPLQNPGAKMYTSSVLFSLNEGVGKSLIGITMGKIYGSNFSAITQADIHKSFNEWSVNKQFVLGDDVTGSDRRADADLLKVMVTRETMIVDKKYQPTYVVPDCINYLFTTNQPDAFFLGRADRRFAIFEIEGAPLSEKFYKQYDHWLWKTNGPAALFHHLLNGIDCASFNPKAPAPMTSAKSDMISLSRSELDHWAIELHEHPDNVLQIDGTPIKRVFWTAQELLALYDPLNQKKSNLTALSKSLRRAGFTSPQITRITAEGNHSGITKRLWVCRDRERWAAADPHERRAQYQKERPLTKDEKQAKF